MISSRLGQWIRSSKDVGRVGRLREENCQEGWKVKRRKRVCLKWQWASGSVALKIGLRIPRHAGLRLWADECAGEEQEWARSEGEGITTLTISVVTHQHNPVRTVYTKFTLSQNM
jgi:hypothetical protein